jgi:hypothetical protein
LSHAGDIGPVFLDVDADEACPLQIECDHRTGECRTIDQHYVARLEEEPAGEIEAVLSRGSDDGVVPADMDVVAFEKPQHGVQEGCFAGARRVLHDAVNLAVECLLCREPKLGPLKDLGRGETAREGYDLRVGQVLKGLPDGIALVVANVGGKTGTPIASHGLAFLLVGGGGEKGQRGKGE